MRPPTLRLLVVVQVRELEEEIRGERPRGEAAAAGQQARQEEEEEEEEEEGGFDIDSGDEGEAGGEEAEEGSSSSSDDEDEEEEEAAGAAQAGDPADADLAAAAAGESAGEEEEAEGQGGEVDGEAAAGGAADVDADDDAGLCAALFKVRPPTAERWAGRAPCCSLPAAAEAAFPCAVPSRVFCSCHPTPPRPSPPLLLSLPRRALCSSWVGRCLASSCCWWCARLAARRGGWARGLPWRRGTSASRTRWGGVGWGRQGGVGRVGGGSP